MRRPLQALLAPKPLHTIAVHISAFPPPQAVGHPTAQEDVLDSNLAKTTTQSSLLDGDNFGQMALCTAALTHHVADAPLGCPLTLLQDHDGPPRCSGLRSFPRRDP